MTGPPPRGVPSAAISPDRRSFRAATAPLSICKNRSQPPRMHPSCRPDPKRSMPQPELVSAEPAARTMQIPMYGIRGPSTQDLHQAQLQQPCKLTSHCAPLTRAQCPWNRSTWFPASSGLWRGTPALCNASVKPRMTEPSLAGTAKLAVLAWVISH